MLRGGAPLVLLAALLGARAAHAHNGVPPIAYLTQPLGVETIVDQSYELAWIDLDQSIPTGTATVELFYTRERPPTFVAGRLPQAFTSTTIVAGIPEYDRTNRHRWDTRAVPSGTYWVYSLVHEPPSELGNALFYTFAPGLLRVVHPPDPVPPAVLISKPDTPFRFADRSYQVQYRAADPHGTGRVRLEATQAYDGTGLTVIADDLPATSTGTFSWDTSGLVEGDWLLKATITDDRGMSFSTFANYFLLIMHFNDGDAGLPPPVDAGGASPDAGAAPADAGSLPPPAEEGCACASSGRTDSTAPLGWLGLALCARRRRRTTRRPARPA